MILRSLFQMFHSQHRETYICVYLVFSPKPNMTEPHGSGYIQVTVY